MSTTVHNEKDESLLPAKLIYSPDESYSDQSRMYQGIPGIELTANNHGYMAFYSGGKDEGSGNYIVVGISNDKCKTFKTPYMIISPPTDMVRCFDPCLWIDPDKRLWVFYAQSYTFYDGRMGVWCCVCDDPDAENPVFSEPRRIANGIMMNKPIVTSKGDWLLPCAIWEGFQSDYNFLPEERFSNVYRSADNGVTFELIGHADYIDRYIDEHMTVEKENGDILMLIRAKKGIGQSISKDGGVTWSKGIDSGLGGPCSRFCIRRLASGNLVLINHHDFKGRNNLKAMISADDGKTWSGYLTLDERSGISYPDLTEDSDGNIYVIYDYNRYSDREILLAVIKEPDIAAGEIINPDSCLKYVLNKATGSRE